MINLLRIQCDVIFAIASQFILDLVIAAHLHTLTCQIGFHIGCKLVGVDAQDGFRGTNQQVGHEHGVAMHVGAAQVQSPGNVVEGRNQGAIGMLSAQCLTNAGQLVSGSFACIPQGLNLHRVFRDAGTVFPDDCQ